MTFQPNRPVILCLSHLAWDFVWQRPQQILSRLARHYRVLYVNEPEIRPDYHAEPFLQAVPAGDGVSAWQPIFPDQPEVLRGWRQIYLELVRGLLPWERPFILWFYTPTPYYFLDAIPADLVVYDVMDELASFKHAASDLPEREARLLARADLVFAGGRSLYEARRERHPNLHLFPSGVDPSHFAAALRPETPIPAEVAELPRPVLGYYGVIDERIDLELLRRLAARRPAWSIVMVGPVAKIGPSDLPRLPNLHYPGQQPYERLPGFLRAFDVCLMPFALNEATRSISPTKTLEYMAAHKPIVSTPVPDVVASWSDVVRIAPDADGFITAVEAALDETAEERAAREERERAVVARNTWTGIAESMHGLIQAALGRRAQ